MTSSILDEKCYKCSRDYNFSGVSKDVLFLQKRRLGAGQYESVSQYVPIWVNMSQSESIWVNMSHLSLTHVLKHSSALSGPGVKSKLFSENTSTLFHRKWLQPILMHFILSVRQLCHVCVILNNWEWDRGDHEEEGNQRSEDDESSMIHHWWWY